MTATAEPAPAVDAVAAMAGTLRRGIRLFTTVGDQPRARRATDVILLTTSLIGILLIGLIAVPEPGFSRAITDFMSALPDALVGMWQVLADLPILWGLIVLGAAFVRGRSKIGRDMLLALVVGAAMWLVISRVVNGSWPEFAVLWSDAAPPPVFPSARLGIPTALVVTASPHLVRPARRLGYLVIALGSIAAVALQASTTLGIVAALLSAAGAGAIVHLIVGSSAGRPSLDDVRYALDDMNVPIAELGVADRQDAGQFTVAARGVDGSRLVVKLYGRDAHDAALVSAVWRKVWLRQPGSPVGWRRLRQVEHEALLTLLAAQAGIATDSVVTAGATHNDDAVLVLRRTAEPLVPRDRFADVVEPPPAVFTGPDTAARLDEIWRLVSALHDRGIVHGQLDEDRLVLDDGQLGLVDFRGAAVAPTEAQEHGDNAQMFVTTIGLFGRDAAVSGLIEHRSPEQIEELLPYLQPTALTSDQRRMTKAMAIDLDDLRSEVAAAAGLESPR
jgi:glycosyltransferase 2 family protein